MNRNISFAEFISLRLIREWYGYHFPELIRIIPDNYTYARAVHLIKNRKEFSNDREEELEAITMDSGKTAAVFEAMKTTIGMSDGFLERIRWSFCSSY
jgi:RNA processing factor Prp31